MRAGRSTTTDLRARRACAALLLLISSCARRPRDAGEAPELETLSATVRVSVDAPAGRRRARGLLGVDRRGALRLELHDPVGRTRLMLVAAPEGGAIAFDDTYLASESGDQLLESVLGSGVTVSEVVEAVLDGSSRGSALVVEGRPAERILLDVGEGTRIEVTLSDPGSIDDPSAFALPERGKRRTMDPEEARALWRRL